MTVTAAADPLLGTLGFVAAVVVLLADGRNAVAVVTLVSGLCLAPLAAEGSGAGAATALILVGAGASVLLVATRWLGHRLSGIAGVDPVVPVVASGEALFGPRSVRVAAGAATLPAASWVSFNVPIGTATTVSGVLFPAVVVCTCAAVRLLTARTLNDVAVGVAALGVAAAAAWAVAVGVDTVAGVAAAVAVAPAAAVTVGWLSGRHAAVA